MQPTDFAAILRDGLIQLKEIDSRISETFARLSPDDLGVGFKEILVEQMREALSDETGLVKRSVKIQMIYLIERCSEVLQDLSEKGELTQSAASYMRYIEKANRFATKIATLKQGGTGSTLLEDYDRSLIPVSFLDPVSSTEKEQKRKAIRDSFKNFRVQGV